jgi:hypothetical protein
MLLGSRYGKQLTTPVVSDGHCVHESDTTSWGHLEDWITHQTAAILATASNALNMQHRASNALLCRAAAVFCGRQGLSTLFPGRALGMPAATRLATEISPGPLRSRMRCPRVQLAATVRSAREAVKHAASEDSDDLDRDQSVRISRHAFAEYEKLVAAAPAGSVERAEFEASFKPDIDALKEELYMSRKPRIWMAVYGWF